MATEKHMDEVCLLMDHLEPDTPPASRPTSPDPAASRPTSPDPAASRPTSPDPAASRPTFTDPAASRPTSPCFLLEEEDLKLQEMKMKESEREQKKIVSVLEKTGPNRRYHQLMHLLEKSSIYTGFLLEKIKQEEEESKKREEEEKREEGDSAQTRRRSKRTRAIMSDVIDTEVFKKKQKLNAVGDSAPGPPAPGPPAPAPRTGLQPHLLTGAELRDYQLYGVNWITTLYDNGMNGILADEMGLGKTIQSIGVLANLIQLGVTGPFLVVVPLSTLSNWKREFHKFAPDIPTVVFHGKKQERSQLYASVYQQPVSVNGATVQVYPALLTSYEMVMIEHAFLKRFKWRLLVVDEGHRIKNMNCNLIRSLKALHSDNRLLLTGTPLQNNLAELWSLLNFILPSVFDDLDAFQMWFDFSSLESEDGKEKIIENEKEGQVLSKLHQILSPFLLRRLKTDVELNIPSKQEIHVYASMTELQERYYKAILERRILDLLTCGQENKASEYGKGLRRKKNVNYCETVEEEDPAKWGGAAQDIYQVYRGTAVLEKGSRNSLTSALKVIWVQLKKCCNHPYLINYPTDKDGFAIITEEVLNCSGKMLLLHRMLPSLISQGHKVLIFSTMTKLLDIIADYLSLYDWQHSRLDGSMKMSDRDENIQRFQNDPDCNIFLLSTRAGGLGLNLMAADTVILFDSDWNPQCDLQAQDRAHRIGQTKKVVVYRFLTKNTMDQKIVERGISKRFLEKMVIHKGKFKHHGVEEGAISEGELQSLFECAALDALNTDHKPQDVLSDKDLVCLLERDVPLPKSSAYTVVETTTTATISS